MKCSVYGKEFNSLVEKVTQNQPKRTVLPCLYTIKLTAQDGALMAEGTDTESYISFFIPATIYEAGTVYINADKLKKVSGITTESVIIEADAENVRVNSTKKKFETTQQMGGSDVDSIMETFKNLNDVEYIAIYNEQYFIDNLGAIDCCRSENDNNRLLTGFHIDTTKNQLTTVDGHRVGIANIEGSVEKEDSFTVGGYTYKILKGLRKGVKADRTITIYADKKNVYFSGDDYTFAVKKIEGEWFKLGDLMKSMEQCTDSFQFETKEMKGIAKEYKAAISAAEKLPMILYKNESGLHTAMENSDYRTVDTIESFKVNHESGDEFLRAVDPVFILDAMGMFDEETVELAGNANFKHPIMLRSGNRMTVILPVNLANNGFSLVDYVKRTIAA